ncbi:MAG: hypothetical protein Q9172_002320 [Xanthocarpia lactea]
MDELFNAAPEAPLLPPQHRVVEGPPTGRHRTPEPKKRSQRFYDDLKLVFDCHIPFTSHSKKKAKKPRKSPRPDDANGRPFTPVRVAVPPRTRHPQPPFGAHPGPAMTPIPHPAPPSGPAGPTPPVTVYSLSSNDSSPSLISPLRVHQRLRARSLSLNRRYEERKEAMREREQREHLERVAFAENEARIRAEREAQRLRNERDRERRHNEELRVRQQRRLEDGMRLRVEDEDRQRKRRSQEGRERAAAIVAGRRREELDRCWEAQAIVDRERRAEARRRREEEQRRERTQEEQDRLTRQRRARIPRGPRHAAVLHHQHQHQHQHHHHHRLENNAFGQRAREEFEDRGDWVLNDAMRAEQFRPTGRGAPQDVQPRWPPENGLRRRGTIAAGERRFFDDDFRRWGRRWF